MIGEKNSWPLMRLSECCISIADGDHQPPPKAESGVPFVTIANIVSNKFDFSDTMYVPMAYYEALDSKRKAMAGDILYSVVGSFGIPVFIDDNVPFVFQRHIAILRPSPDIILPKFLYYTMLSRKFYQMADAAAVGAAQRTVSLTALRNMKISVPSIDIQQKIVDTLAPYDDLIATNQKQISLLEEAAQRIYKEWFIDFHFPGYESTTFENGIPVGWRKVSVTDLLTIQYGKDHRELNNGSIPVYGSGGVMRNVDRKLYSGESVLIPRKGSLNNIFYVNGDFWTIDTMFYSIPRLPNIAQYAYLFLKTVDMYSYNIGAAVPSMTVNILNGISVLLPNEEILTLFSKSVSPLFSAVATLNREIAKTTQARDLLLPRLLAD